MDQREHMEVKIGLLFRTADQYLSGQIRKDAAKRLIGNELERIRPVQLEAMKIELAKRLNDASGKAEADKLFDLFGGYLSPPYHKLKAGHPLRNYYEENCRLRPVLLRMDEMESEREAATDDWIALYTQLNGFAVHIRRMEQNFYPLLVPLGMGLQIENARELGAAILRGVAENMDLLENGSLVDFLVDQRTLCQCFMGYLDLEERVLSAKALISFPERDFVRLRSADDHVGYALIEKPVDFSPEEIQTADPEQISYHQIKEHVDIMEEIDKEQNIGDLFHMFPRFKEDFFELDGDLSGLNGPVGMDLLKNCTVAMIAKSLRIDTGGLVDRINQQLKRYRSGY